MGKPKVLVVSGHRSYNDAGNPNEKALTPFMSAAYEKALEAAGYEVTHLQREFDGDSDPDDTVGGLDTVGWLCHEWMRQTPGQLVMIDCHYEGASAPGCFAIVPDKKGLGTAIQINQPTNDQWENNPLDVTLARAIAKGISAATGLPLRQGIKEPGVMSETQTGVALQYNARLAMFAYTAPYRDRAVRLVVEHGSLPVASDKAIIMQPDFTQKCADSLVRVMDSIFGQAATTPDPAPEPPKDEYTNPLPVPFKLGIDLGWGYQLNGCPVNLFVTEVEALKGVVPRAWASAKAPKSAPTIPVKTKFSIYGDCITEDKKQWFFLEDSSRIEARSVTPIIKFRKR